MAAIAQGGDGRWVAGLELVIGRGDLMCTCTWVVYSLKEEENETGAIDLGRRREDMGVDSGFASC